MLLCNLVLQPLVLPQSLHHIEYNNINNNNNNDDDNDDQNPAAESPSESPPHGQGYVT